MRVIVSPHTTKIEKEYINEKEINVTKCTFEFADEITADFVKEAYFTAGDKSYKQIITNNECNIPYEVLEKQGEIEIGVVAYLVEDETEIKRYNPTSDFVYILSGSLKEAENTEPITPSEMEQFEQALQEGLNELAIAVQGAENIDIDASKSGNVATITITNQEGTTKEVEITDGSDGIDGVGLDYNWSGTSLGIKKENEQEYQYVNLKGDTGNTGANGQDGKDGKDGKDGVNGTNGTDGVSPIITTSKDGKTTTLTIVDTEGTKTATILDGNDGSNGNDGQDGNDGFSPIASVSKSGNTATISITDKNGTTTTTINDGQNGANGNDGNDGFSPIANVSKSGNTVTISITDSLGTTTTTVSDGQNGQNGQDGYTPVKGVDYFTQQDIASLKIPTRTLIWENEHPYDTFTAQSIDLLSSNYDYLEIEFAEWAGNEETNMTKVVKNKPHRISEFFVPTDSKFIADTRRVEFTSEIKLSFSDGKRYQVFNNNSSTVNTNNNVVVPRKIFGIKY